VNFWFTRIQANKSAIKAVLMNRISDIFFLVSICLCLTVFETANISVINSLSPFYLNLDSFFGLNFVDIIALFFLISAVGKSAQVGLHLWLPDAMEGPTPVSALIHSATMVTAGIFLVLRFSLLFDSSPTILFLMTLFGISTIFFSSLIGIFQNDIKKIVAYSTCSQLGYMLLACGVSKYVVCFYHLVNHAFFKACLFLACGCVIHIVNEQDIRKIGGLFLKYKLLYLVFFIASLSLSGFPFFSGFFSKELIISFSGIQFFVKEDFIFFYS